MKSEFDGIFNAIKSFLKEKFVVSIMKKILGSPIGGFRAWIVEFLLENLWDEIVDPVLSAGLVELKYTKHKIEGKISAKKILEARRHGNVQDYNDNIDIILS